MENNTERSFLRKLTYVLVIIGFFLLLTEGVLAIFLYQRSGSENMASIEALKTIKNKLTQREFSLNVTNHNLVRPDSAKDVNHAIAEETIISNRFVYDSWVEFRMMDFHGKYMNMSGSIRRTSPDAFINPASTDTVDIYFFGGSTMFGFNVLDYETIPAQFLELYKEKYPNGKSVRVFNYGIPTYYSYQELIQLSDLIFEGHKPSILVFLDGINDFWFATASYYRQSYFSYIFRQVFNHGLRSKGEFDFRDTADAMFKDPKYMPLKQYNDGIINNYLGNMVNIKMMAKMIDAKPYFFLQPSPFYNYPNQQTDPMCFKDTNTRFDYIYPQLEKKSARLANFTFLGNMLVGEQGYPFVDGLHYSPKFIRKVSAEILKQVEKDL